MEEQTLMRMLKGYFAGRPEVRIAYLFGSQATGGANRLSDTDIAVLIDDSVLRNERYPYGYRATLTTDLMKLLKSNAVDVVILNQAPCLLKHRVIRHGQILYSTSEQERLLFQFNVMKRYLDFKPMLRVHHARQGSC